MFATMVAIYTVKTLGLLQAYFCMDGCLSISVAYYTRNVTKQFFSFFVLKTYLATFLPLLLYSCNQGTPPGADVYDQRTPNFTRNAAFLGRS